MRKSSRFAGLGLLIGIGGLLIIGLGMYSYYNFSNRLEDLNTKLEERSVRAIYYRKYFEDWNPNTTNTNQPVITINFTVNNREEAYFLFVTSATIYSNSGLTVMNFTFSLDGVVLDKPCITVGGLNVEEPYLNIPVVLQHSTGNLAEGKHSASVMVLNSFYLNYIRSSTFLIQTYYS